MQKTKNKKEVELNFPLEISSERNFFIDQKGAGNGSEKFHDF